MSTISLSGTPINAQASFTDIIETVKLYYINGQILHKVSDGLVVLVGLIMGGMISITLAMKHPALIERLELLSPTITGRLSNFINTIIAPVFLIERFLLGSLRVSGVEKAIVGITDRLMHPVSFAERSGITLENYKRLMADARWRGQGRVRADCFFDMRENDLNSRLAQVEPPSLVVWGAEDNTVPLRDAGVVADEWPAADLRIVLKAGHRPHFEVADITRRLAAQFCQMEVPPHSNIVNVDEAGNEMSLVHSGTVEVWSDPENLGPKPLRLCRIACVLSSGS